MSSITIEPIIGGPGYLAAILNGDETDPLGVGMTREAAALDLVRNLLDDAHPDACRAIGTMLREAASSLPGPESGDRDAFVRTGIERAAALVEGIA